MRRRPLLAVLIGLSTGITAARLIGLTAPPFWAVPLAVAIFLASIPLERRGEDKMAGTAVIVILSALLGASYYSATYFDPSDLYPELHDLSHAVGTIADFPVEVDGAIEFTVELDDYPGRFKVYTDEEREVNYGDLLRIEGDFRVPEGSEDFDYREYLRMRKTWGLVYDARLTRLPGKEGNPVMALGWFARKRVFKRIEGSFPENGGFIKAVLFGARDFLNDEDVRAFEVTGLAHLLAASGLHLGILIGGVWLILSWFGLSRRWIYLLSLPLLSAYLLIVGFKFPLVRASLIYLFSGAGFYFQDRGLILSDWYDLYNSLTGAAIFLLLVRPTSLTDVGFQLSFGATFAIAYLFRPIDTNLNPIKPRYVRETLAASLAAQFGVLPIIAVHFNRVHPWGTLLSLFFIPMITIILYLSTLSIGVGNLYFLGSSLSWATSSLIDRFNRGLEWGSTLPLVAVEPGELNSFTLAAYFIFLVWLKRRLSREGEPKLPIG
ncbi:MAG: ComEC/Rec2 family competence protein [Candidatus Bipolaricaulota bacterium]